VAGVERTPEDRFERLADWRFEPRYVDQDGLRMHYVDEGAGAPILLLHGEPTWAYLYRKAIPALARADRVVAPDYFGFGRSDKPLRLQDYSYDFHVRSIERLADELDLRDATVVVQDWGGPVGLRLAVERPDRIGKLVIMNTGIGGGRPPSEEWLRFRDWMERLGTDIVPGRLVEISAVQPIAAEVVEAYSAPWPVPESKQGILAFPGLVPISPDHPDLPAHMAVREALSNWDRPALVLFSDSDPIFSPRAAERIAAHIPGAGEPEIVAGAGHFLQEDQGELIGRRISEFVLS
jgi:haloalkane dehalogenase